MTSYSTHLVVPDPSVRATERRPTSTSLAWELLGYGSLGQAGCELRARSLPTFEGRAP